MSKQIIVKMINGEKEIDINVSEPNDETQSIILSGILDFMDVEYSENMLKLQKMYSDFYNNVTNPEFCESGEIIEDGLITVNTSEDALNTMSEEYLFKHGIKKNVLGDYVYRCRYECPECGNQGNHYISINHRTVDCHNCDRVLFVTKSTEELLTLHGYHFLAGKIN